MSAGTGTVASANVTNVRSAARRGLHAPPLQAQFVGSDANGVESFNVTSPDDGPGSHVLRVLTPTNPAPGVPHNFLYVLPVEPELGTLR